MTDSPSSDDARGQGGHRKQQGNERPADYSRYVGDEARAQVKVERAEGVREYAAAVYEADKLLAAAEEIAFALWGPPSKTEPLIEARRALEWAMEAISMFPDPERP